ncbi:cytochrome P450 [Amanita rubescens]|nr:cytochrome P450 [Amanita rubescens]
MHTIVLGFLASATVYLLIKLAQFIYWEHTSPLKRLPGPKSTSWIYGNLNEILESDTLVYEKWASIYGPTFKYKRIFGLTSLATMDIKAVSHILMNSNLYEKPDFIRHATIQLLGDGLLVAEGDKHRQQRRIMNPAFGTAQIRELTTIFVDKAIELRDALETEIMKQKGPAGPIVHIDILTWITRMTLDVIGLAGFNYQFNALSGDGTNELQRALATVFKPRARLPLMPLIRARIPILRFLVPEGDAESKKAKQTMTRIAHKLLEDSRAALIAEKISSLAKDLSKGRDILSLLVRANMATDLPSNQRMCDDDVMAQIPTFFVAGHETTSVATTWALFALAQRADVQQKLRVELLSFPTDNPTMDELNALPYLDKVVREVMRLYAPVPLTARVATADDIIPLEIPVKDEEGNIQEYIRIKKGRIVSIPLLAMNRAVSIWGEDAAEFKPERWESIPQAVHRIPSVWGNQLTFLGGPHACIGFKFSVVEMKALLFTLLRAFEFQLAVPAADIKRKALIVLRPVLASDPNGKNQLPLLIKVYQHPDSLET